MIIFIWVMGTYLVSACITYPLIKFKMDIINEDELNTLDSKFLARVGCIIPIVNLIMGYKGIKAWVEVRKNNKLTE